VRVVINPGHGWLDPGAVGPTGLREQDVVRQVAIAVCACSGDGLEYEPKRQGKLGLFTLTRALRKNAPAVVVSLHCDAGTDHLHQSRITWWEGDPDGVRRQASARLANAIARTSGAYCESAKVVAAPYARSDKGKPFTPGILVNTATRATVLVELGFISDPHTEAAMRTGAWVNRAAAALDASLREWVSES
jgi:N-acetylmuramoyl-L-alanine amidase